MECEDGWGAAAAVAEPDRRPAVPWEDPELSLLAGFFRTLREVLFRPGEFFENLGREGWAEPLAFALIVSSVGLLGAIFWQFLVLAPANGNPGDTAGLSLSWGLSPGWLMGLMAVSPVLVLADLGVGGICWWGSVALVGAGRDFTPAWRIFCYAHGGMALALIPYLRHVGGRNLGPGPDVLRGKAGLRHLRRGLSRGPGYLPDASGRPGAVPYPGPGGHPGLIGVPAAAGLKRFAPLDLPAASALFSGRGRPSRSPLPPPG